MKTKKDLILSAGCRSDFLEMIAHFYFSTVEKIQLMDSGAVLNGSCVVSPRWEYARGRFRLFRVVSE